MTIEQTLGDILDQTVEAFSHASFLEQRMVVIAASNVNFENSDAATRIFAEASSV